MKTTEQTVADYAASIAADFPHLCAAQVGGMVTDALAADDECQDVDWRELDRLAYAAAVAAGAAR